MKSIKRKSLKRSRSKSINKSLNKINTKTFINYEKLTNKTKTYLIHDNGGRPFSVVASNAGINVYSNNNDTLLLHIPTFIGYWSGYDSSEYRMHGNSILIQKTPTTYIEIGWNIYEFTTPEPILDYISPVGNSDVPYPVAYSKHYVYFMLDQQYVPRDQFITKANVKNAQKIYREFYGIIHKDNHNNVKLSRKEMENVNVLVERK